MHFVLRHLKRSMCQNDIQVIATNLEQFISIQFQSLRFIDSCQFMNASLKKLVVNLRQSGVNKFRHTVRPERTSPDDRSLYV